MNYGRLSKVLHLDVGILLECHLYQLIQLVQTCSVLLVQHYVQLDMNTMKYQIMHCLDEQVHTIECKQRQHQDWYHLLHLLSMCVFASCWSTPTTVLAAVISTTVQQDEADSSMLKGSVYLLLLMLSRLILFSAYQSANF